MRSQLAPASAASASATRVQLVVDDADAERGAALEHRELLGQDQLARVAEHALVIEADVGQTDHAGVDDARGVVAAAQTGLDDAGLDAGLREHEERGRRERLELRRPLPQLAFDGARRVLHAVERHGERGRADRAAVDLHALVPADHVRREVGARPHPRRRQRGSGEAHGRGLAVRADDVNRVEPLLRIAELGEQRRDALQPELHPERGERLQIAVFGHAPRPSSRCAQLVRLALEALQLVALLLHQMRGSALHEPFVGELAAGALDLGLGLRELLLEAGTRVLGPAGRQHGDGRVADGDHVDGTPLAVGRGRARTSERLDQRRDRCERPALQREWRARRHLARRRAAAAA